MTKSLRFVLISFFLPVFFAFFFGGLVLKISPVSAEINEWNPDWGTDGFLTYDDVDDADYEFYTSIAVQEDGKVLVATDTYDTFNTAILHVFRFNSDGTLDTDFGTDGAFEYAVSGNDIANDIVIQEDGKILVAGVTDTTATLIRLLSTGEYNTSFGVSGIATSETSNDWVTCVKIADDGSIYIAGSILNDPTIWKFTSEGELDSNFGTDGVYQLDGVMRMNIVDLDILLDGRIVGVATEFPLVFWGGPLAHTPTLGVTTNSIIFVVSEPGTLDFIADSGAAWASQVIVQPDGMVLALDQFVLDLGGGGLPFGSNSTQSLDLLSTGAVLRRYDPDEFVMEFSSTSQSTTDHMSLLEADPWLDPSFGTDGVIHLEGETGEAMALDNLGRIFLSTYVRDENTMTIWGYDNTGTLLTSFGTDGSVVFGALPPYTGYYANGMALHPGNTGSIFVAGLADDNNESFYDLAVWNYQYAFQVANLPETLAVYDEEYNDVLLGSEFGLVGENGVLLETATGYPLVFVEADFTNDLDWSVVEGETDLAGGKSVVTGFDVTQNSYAEGITGTHVLYVPKRSDDDTVRICPNAISLAEISIDCADGFEFKEGDAGVAVIDFEGNTYWAVLNMSNTGGMSFNNSLIRTGMETVVPVLLGLTGIFSSLSPIVNRKKVTTEN